MEFSTIAFVLLGVGLPVFYLAMIIHDIYFVKDAEELMPKPEELEVDISDEAGQFQPILIDKDAPPKTAKPVQEVKAKQTRQTNTADQPVVSAPKGKDKNEAEDKEKSKDKEKSDEDDNDKTKVPTAQSDNVPEPVVADKEARKRIQELVRIRRQQIHSEELAAAKEKSKQQPEVVVETQEHKPKDAPTFNSASPVVYISADDEETPKTTSSSSKSKQTKKQRPIPAYFYYKAKVTVQDTAYCGGQTAEKLSEEVKRVSADKVEMITKMIDSEWEETDAEPRELDEDEKIAIEMAKQRSHKHDVPTVNF